MVQEAEAQAQDLVLYDPACRLCRAAVRFIIDRDPRRRFVFAALDSEIGRSEIEAAAFEDDPQGSIVLITPLPPAVRRRYYRRSGAALRIARGLRFPWPMLAVFLVVPAFLRDPLYQLVARYRYRFFGKVATTGLPVPSAVDRFLDADEAPRDAVPGACKVKL